MRFLAIVLACLLIPMCSNPRHHFSKEKMHVYKVRAIDTTKATAGQVANQATSQATSNNDFWYYYILTNLDNSYSYSRSRTPISSTNYSALSWSRSVESPIKGEQVQEQPNLEQEVEVEHSAPASAEVEHSPPAGNTEVEHSAPNDHIDVEVDHSAPATEATAGEGSASEAGGSADAGGSSDGGGGGGGDGGGGGGGD